LIVRLFLALLFTSKLVLAQSISELQTFEFCKTIPDQAGGEIQKLTSAGCSVLLGSHTFSTTGIVGRYRITGTPYEEVDIQFSNGTLTGLGSSMSVHNFSISSSFQFLNSSGYFDFSVQGNATIGANQTVDNYSGNYTIGYKYSSSRFWIGYNANISLDILPIPITITQQAEMFFDEVAGDPSGGTIRLNHNGTLQNISGNSYFHGGGQKAGTFLISGSPNSSVSISFIAGSLSGPGTAISISNFSHDAGASPILGTTGNLSLDVGADLTINPNQTVGSYSGKYTIQINY